MSPTLKYQKTTMNYHFPTELQLALTANIK